MKKKLALLLLASLMGLSACGQGVELIGSVEQLESEEAIASVELSHSDTEQSAAENSGDQTASGTEEDTEEKQLPVVTVESLSAVRYTEDGQTQLASVTEDSLTLTGDGYEKASEAVERLLGSSQADVEELADSYAEDALEQYAFEKESGYEYFSPYTSQTFYEIARMDTRILSVKNLSYDYSGGAHGYGAYWGTTIDLESGRELELPHLMEDIMCFWTKAEKVVLDSLAEREEELFDDYATYVSENLEETNWYLDGAGIEFCFTPYEIGPYSSGTIIVCVPYGEVADYMKEEYCNVQGEAIYLLPQNEKISFCPAEDGETVSVLFEYRTLEEYRDELLITLNGQETSLGENIRLCHAYLIHRSEGRSFLLFDIDWASDDYETFVYEVTDGTLVQTDCIGAFIAGRNMNFNCLELTFNLQVLGSYLSNGEYRLTEEGKLEQLNQRYEIANNYDWQGLTVVRELPVKVDGKDAVVPAGSRIHIAATDNNGIAWFETADGITGEIHYERKEDDYQLYINGISEYEYFEMLPYAG